MERIFCQKYVDNNYKKRREKNRHKLSNLANLFAFSWLYYFSFISNGKTQVGQMIKFYELNRLKRVVSLMKSFIRAMGIFRGQKANSNENYSVSQVQISLVYSWSNKEILFEICFEMEEMLIESWQYETRTSYFNYLNIQRFALKFIPVEIIVKWSLHIRRSQNVQSQQQNTGDTMILSRCKMKWAKIKVVVFSLKKMLYIIK